MNVSVRDLKNSLSEHLARVRRGERVIVTLRGRPIAEIMPAVEPTQLSEQERLQRLADAGELTLGKSSPGSSHDFAPAPTKKVRGRAQKTASQIILEDRD